MESIIKAIVRPEFVCPHLFRVHGKVTQVYMSNFARSEYVNIIECGEFPEQGYLESPRHTSQLRDYRRDQELENETGLKHERFWGSLELKASSIEEVLEMQCFGSIDVYVQEGKVIGCRVFYSADSWQRGLGRLSGIISANERPQVSEVIKEWERVLAEEYAEYERQQAEQHASL